MRQESNTRLVTEAALVPLNRWRPKIKSEGNEETWMRELRDGDSVFYPGPHGGSE